MSLSERIGPRRIRRKIKKDSRRIQEANSRITEYKRQSPEASLDRPVSVKIVDDILSELTP
jgi:hypothetical protein